MSFNIPSSRFLLLPTGFLLIVLSFSGGCGKNRPADLPRLYPVTLVLVQSGKPLANAMVTMVDAAGESKWPASGRTDHAGNAVMYVNGVYPGAPLGEHKVTVFKMETDQAPSDGTLPPDDPNDWHHWQEEQAKLRAKAKTYSHVASEFSDAEKTPLTVTVVQGKNRFELDLGAEVKIEVKIDH